MAKVVIIGAGMMGSALAFPARENGNEVALVGTPLDREIIETSRKTGRHPKFEKDFPAGVTYYQIEEVDRALVGADLIIGGVSSFGVEWFGDVVLPILPENVPVLTVTKGLMDTPDGKLLTYPALWQAKLDKLGKKVPLTAVGGPCTSYELVADDPTHVSFCGEDMAILEMLRAHMETDTYHISITTDVIGIESAVALKNGYALAIALTVGVNQRAFGEDSPLHFNSQAAVFGRSVWEMQRLLRMQGAKEPDESLAVGAGDLYVTVYGGRTRKIGILLGRGIDPDEAVSMLGGVTLESLVVARRVANALRIRAERGEVALSDFPVLMRMDDILSRRAEANIDYDAIRFS